MLRRAVSRFSAVALSIFLLVAAPALLKAQTPVPPIPSGHVRIHYFRPDGNYLGWTVYAFGDTTEDTSNFNGGPVFVTGYDTYGAFYDVGLTATPHDLGFIVHNISTGIKDPGPDMHLNVAQLNEAWVLSGSATVFLAQP